MLGSTSVVATTKSESIDPEGHRFCFDRWDATTVRKTDMRKNDTIMRPLHGKVICPGKMKVLERKAA